MLEHFGKLTVQLDDLWSEYYLIRGITMLCPVVIEREMIAKPPEIYDLFKILLKILGRTSELLVF